MERPSGLELASEILANITHFNEMQLKQKAIEENSIVYGQVNGFL